MSTSGPSSRQSWVRPFLAIVVLALTLRIALAFALGEEPRELAGTFDQIAYDMLAQRINAGYGYSFPIDWYPFSHANQQTAHWSFIYPLYLSSVYSIAGHYPLVARLVQILFSVLNLLLVFRLGRRLFDASAGLFAAALTACYAYLILFNASLMTQSFYILAVLGSLDLALGIVSRPQWRRWLLLGAVLGIGALLRQTLLLFAPILFGWIWWRLGTAPGGPGKLAPLRGMALAVLVIAGFVLPWTLRNYSIYHDFLLLNSNGGYWFYSSNHPGQGTNFDPTFKAPLPAEVTGLQEPAIDRMLMRDGIGFVVNDPVRFARLSLSRINDYFWLAPSEDSTDLSNWSRLFSFGLYLPFMLAGLYLSRAKWRECLPLYLYVAFDSVFCLLSWAAPRYRLPSDAVMMVFAGLAASTLAIRLHIISPIAPQANKLTEG